MTRARIVGRTLIVTSVAILLALLPACAVNRHVVRMQTQMQLLNDDFAIRQQKVAKDLESMTQLTRHNRAALEAVRETVEKMQRQVVASHTAQNITSLTERAEDLRKSAQELNSRMTAMEVRVEAMNDAQYNLFHSAVVPQSETGYETSVNKSDQKPNP